MITRALYTIAGVDRETVSSCPPSDRLWAAHLGFSLLLSFSVVLGIAFHATGYMFADNWVRVPVAVLVALTLFMFDRALYQSDWFLQGAFRNRLDPWTALRRFFRIILRLSISLGLAWVIAVFLELAIFSDTISERIRRDNVAANRPVYAKIEQYEAQLTADIERRRNNLLALEELYRRNLTDNRPTPDTQSNEHESQRRALDDEIKYLDAQEQDLSRELRSVEERIVSFAEDMNAEQLGQRLNRSNSGIAGSGPRFQFARQQKEVYETRRTALQNELSQRRAKREDVTAQKGRLAAEIVASQERDRVNIQAGRDALSARVDAARTELSDLERSRIARIEAFRQSAFPESDFQRQRYDPLSRMTAYQDLKNDLKDGKTITLFSWMTKFLIIFLEIMPVVAKMFFSPPSAYAAKIQSAVERERARLARTVGSIDFESESDAPPVALSPLRPAADLDWPVMGETNLPSRPDVVGGSDPVQLAERESEFAALIPLHEFEQRGDRSREWPRPSVGTAQEGLDKTAVWPLDPQGKGAGEPRISEIKKSEPSSLRPRRR